MSSHLPTLPSAPDGKPLRLQRPEWLKVRANTTGEYEEVRRMMRRLSLVTVCEEARCPNIHECWARERTATFMLMGDVCTRHCGFCAVGKDLADGGGAHFATTIRAIRRRLPGCTVEVLIPDFRGDADALEIVLAEEPEVLNHNTETVPRLYKRVRLLARTDSRRRRTGSATKTKSGLMAGLGESLDELLATLADLRAAGCDIATVGQYLQPYEKRLPVERYYTPEEFERIRVEGEAMGFLRVESGPLVRSSYHARRALEAPVA